jgi:hypothetical protein
MYTFEELLEMKSKNLVFVNGDKFLGKICSTHSQDECMVFVNGCNEHTVIYKNHLKKLYVSKYTGAKEIPDEVEIPDRFDAYLIKKLK